MIDYSQLLAASSVELDQLDPKSRQIIEAARQCFADLGFEETTMVQIADLAGVGVATVYRRFGTKSAIVRYALMSESLRISDILLEAMERSAGPVSGLAEMFAAFVEEASRPHLLTRSLRRSSAASEMVDFMSDDSFLSRGRAMVAHYISYWQSRGELGDFDAEIVAEIFVRLEMSFITNPRGVIPLRDGDSARAFAHQFLSPLLFPNPKPAQVDPVSEN
mgnify:CR=1 FL=1